jgi:hypothetical protein
LLICRKVTPQYRLLKGKKAETLAAGNSSSQVCSTHMFVEWDESSAKSRSPSSQYVCGFNGKYGKCGSFWTCVHISR